MSNTNTTLIPFAFGIQDVRVLLLDGEPWFVGKDVAEMLGYADPTNAMKQHCRGVVKRHPIVDALGRTQEVRILAEPDVLRLIVSSKLPGAERFERWLFEDVLPTLRRTGHYQIPDSAPAASELPEPPAELTALQAALIDTQRKLIEAQERLLSARAAHSRSGRDRRRTRPGVPVTEEEAVRMQDLRDQGLSASQVARQLGRSVTSVRAYSHAARDAATADLFGGAQ